MTTAWTAQDVCAIDAAAVARIPVIESVEKVGLNAARIYWDMWPIQQPDGRIANIDGRELWMALSAPDRGDPALRHFEAKIRLLERSADRWIDHGDVLPDADVPYEREWAGSAVIDGKRVTLFFTGAGASDRAGGYQQRLFEAHATLGASGFPVGWTMPRPIAANLTPDYVAADAHEGEAGKIKAYRDPAYFRDPATGHEHLLFTASLACAQSEFNGAVGITQRSGAEWRLQPPLIHADGVNNELERAHAVFHEGRYYVFWSTQRSTFAPGLRDAPNGLYGMVADSLMGDYRPLNGSGLVLANPEDEPLQSYSWFVTRELLVSSFVDFHGLEGRDLPAVSAEANRFFGGAPAPLLQLEIDGDRCKLAAT